MTTAREELIIALLKGLETGDPGAVEVINSHKYIQHNPQTHEGGEGLATLFKRLSLTSPKVNIVRIFSDDDFVFAHTEYEFSTSRVGFEVFRFEGLKTVEHWDNIQLRKGPNPSGHSMTDGSTTHTKQDHTLTKTNKNIIQSFINDILLNRRFELITIYIDKNNYTEHNPEACDGFSNLIEHLSSQSSSKHLYIRYEKNHRILADGNFVLSVCEGKLNNEHTSFYDLFRLEQEKIVEHWDTSEKIPPRSEWKNENGKF